MNNYKMLTLTMSLVQILIYSVCSYAATAPIANFSATPTSGISTLQCVFTDTSTNTPTSWSWNFGDTVNNTSTLQNPLHNYATPGTYTVSLTATNAYGSNTKTQTAYITVTAGTSTTFFTESFETTALSGWYDGATPVTSGGESGNCAVWAWKLGANTPTGTGAMRHLIGTSGTTSLYFKFYMKFATGWRGSQDTFHPHIIHVVSNKDYTTNSEAGLDPTYLSFGVEAWSTIGSPYTPIYPQMWIDDGTNVNTTTCTPSSSDQACVTATENRAVAGCNGSLGDTGNQTIQCYPTGGTPPYDNAETWRITGSSASLTTNQWYEVEVYLQMNAISGGVGVPNGVMREYINGTKVEDSETVLFHTNQYPTMNWEEFVLAPYMAPSNGNGGAPVAETMYFDELTVGNTDPYYTSPPIDTTPPSTPTGVTLKIIQ